MGNNMPTPNWKDKVNRLEAGADKSSDELLDKARSSKWTWVILLGIAAIIVVLVVRAL